MGLRDEAAGDEEIKKQEIREAEDRLAETGIEEAPGDQGGRGKERLLVDSEEETVEPAEEAAEDPVEDSEEDPEEDPEGGEDDLDADEDRDKKNQWSTDASVGNPELLSNGLTSIIPVVHGKGTKPQKKLIAATFPETADGLRHPTHGVAQLGFDFAGQGRNVIVSAPYPIRRYIVGTLPKMDTEEYHSGYQSGYKTPAHCTSFVCHRNLSSPTIRFVMPRQQLAGLRGMMRPAAELRQYRNLREAERVEYVS